MVLFSITEKDRDLIIYNLLSERYHELLNKEVKNERVFPQIEYLYDLYKRKIERVERK